MTMRLPLFALVLVAAGPLAAQGLVPDSGALTLGTDALYADTSSAALRIEHVRLALARTELRALSTWQRLRPSLNTFLSVSTRGIAFPSISSQGYDPAYAAIARWPGDTWGLTLSWSADQLLDRRPVERARAAVALAEARVDLVHARRAEQDARDRQQALARAERLADERQRDARAIQRAAHAAALLRVESGFLDSRLTAQRDLLRLAEMTYAQGTLGYEALARQRLAVLAAEHAVAANAARLAAALEGDVLTPTNPDTPDPLVQAAAALYPDAP